MTIETLDKNVYEYGIDNLTKYDLFSLAIYINEIFRRETSIKWISLKMYTLNPYYQPILSTESGEKFYVSIAKFLKEHGEGGIIAAYSIEYDRFNGNEPIKVE